MELSTEQFTALIKELKDKIQYVEIQCDNNKPENAIKVSADFGSIVFRRPTIESAPCGIY